MSGVSQPAVQRYNSLPSLTAAKQCCLLLAPGYMLFGTLACLCGLAIFANYADCNPLEQGLIQRKDQLVPYFVLDQMSYLTGLPGLFVACIMSGALSTVSSGLNALAAVTWKDFVGNIPLFMKMSAEKQSWALRIISMLYGLVAVGLAFVASNLGGVLQATMSITSAFGGPLLGVFTLGIFVPFANGKGTLAGFVTALAFCIWMSFGAFSSGAQPPPLPSSVAGCGTNLTSLAAAVTSSTPAPTAATSSAPETGDDGPGVLEQYIYTVSYQLYTMVGLLICLLVGIIASIFTGFSRHHHFKKSLVNPTAFRLLNRFNRHQDSFDLKSGVHNTGYTNDEKEAESNYQLATYRSGLEHTEGH
ncbi:Sodium-coupled monocarboxylate transporter 2 [Amphibalanus amphitrite]|uniref:Sodium-coupled monocarboxylate transporter 2 n=1 Tax=Amphibalanus amphitrite TaxID=1232801 RepID=A0A6A4WLM2_AMPAM|nr:Sodium-coupled monocarboxylate transporter 2 [Amphibalanus amphitrite]